MKKNNFTITAHTGCMNTTPNSTESMLAAFKVGADIAEVDVRFDSNGIPVLSHDTLSEKNVYTPLSRIFELLKQYPDKKLNVDIKETSNLNAIQTEAERLGVTEQIFLTGVEDDFVNAVKAQCPKIEYYLNFGKASNMCKFESYIKFLIDKTKTSGAVGINMRKDSCNKKLVDRFKNENLSVSVWTINTFSEFQMYKEMGVNNITCKNPDEICQTLPD